MKVNLLALLILFSFAAPAAAERYALVRLSDKAIEVFSDTVDPTVGTRVGWKWIVAPRVQRPAFDPATQLLLGPTYSVGASLVTEGWTVRNKTAPEMAADKDARADAIGTDLLRVLCAIENHARSAAVPPGAVLNTAAECKAALRAMLP